MKIVIAVPDGEPEDYSDFVAHVASQLAEGYTSGHVNREHHWAIEAVSAESRDQDTCDRCGKGSSKISVGYTDMFGFDGLCNECLDALYRERGF